MQVANIFYRLWYPTSPARAVFCRPDNRGGRQHFRERGYCVLKQAVPSTDLLKFLGTIASDKKKFGWTSRTVQSDLLKVSTAATLLNDLLGLDREQLPDTAQLAIKHPCTDISVSHYDPLTVPRHDFHIDGMPSKDNGVPNGAVQNFSLLVGVALDDTGSKTCHGNLGVLPGSHFALAQAFRAYAAIEGKSNSVDEFLGNKSNGSPGERLKALLRKTGTNWAQFLGEHPPQPVLLNAGDIVVAHYQTVHFVYHNESKMSRKILYFRIMPPSRKWNTNNPKALFEPFLEFPLTRVGA